MYSQDKLVPWYFMDLRQCIPLNDPDDILIIKSIIMIIPLRGFDICFSKVKVCQPIT